MLQYLTTSCDRMTLLSITSSKTCEAAAPRTRITRASFVGSEEPSLKLLRSAKLQRTNSSPISNCRCLKSAIFILRNINSNINWRHCSEAKVKNMESSCVVSTEEPTKPSRAKKKGRQTKAKASSNIPYHTESRVFPCHKEYPHL